MIVEISIKFVTFKNTINLMFNLNISYLNNGNNKNINNEFAMTFDC